MAYKKKEKISLLLYYDYIEQFELLDDSQLRKLIYAMIEYDKTGNEPKLDKMTKMAFLPIKRKLKQDKIAWEEICKKNSENVKKRWEKDTTVYDRIRTDTKVYQSIPKYTKNTDIDIEIEKEIEKDIDKEVVYTYPPTTDEVFNFASSNFENIAKTKLNRSCKKFFDYYEKTKWKDIKDWREKLVQWIEGDIEYGKLEVEESIDDRAKRIFGNN